MRLVSAVLGFVLRKTGLFAALLLSLFLGLLLMSVLVPTLREAEAERHRLQEVAEERGSLEDDLEELRGRYEESQSRAVESLTSEVRADVEEGQRELARQKSYVADRRRDRDEVCGRLARITEKLLPGPNPCEAAQEAVDQADKALRTIDHDLGAAERRAAILRDPELTDAQKIDALREGGEPSPLEREIATKQSELSQKEAEQKSLQQAQASWAGWVVNLWARSWKWLVVTALLLVLMPGALRTLGYFLLMPVVSRAQKPIRLTDGSEHPTASLRAGPAERTLTVRLGPGEVLSARSEHVRPVQGRIRSRLLYDWTSPFISFAAGLYGLSRITGDEDGTEATLATPDDPDSYLMRLDFTDHPGVVMHPRHVVGVVGDPVLETRWRWGIASFATWQVRYIMFGGTGSLIVQGSGDVVATSPGGRSTRMEQNLVMGFDSRLVVGVNRTEVFWPYLWGRTPLVDDEFTGHHPLFWQKSTANGPSNPIAKTFDAFFSAVGKVLGF